MSDVDYDDLRESDLAGLNAVELAAAFNTVYTDYVVPFVMSEAAARQHVASYAIAPERSILWRDPSGAVVGLAALGVRGERGWVGGFGIAPDWRGRGLSGPLLARLLELARAGGLRRVQLEVITSNARAIRTYERAGFRRTRDLLFLTRDEGAAPAADQGLLREVEPQALLAAPPFAPVDPCWQREAASLAHQPDLRGLVLGAGAAARAYAVVSLGATAATIGAIAGESEAALIALVAALPAHLPGRSLRLANEPEESPLSALLLRDGWRELLRQHEMVRDL
jgi:RimJ/RimL family protein N-acetyltransferase